MKYMWKELRFGLFCIKKNIQSSAELRTSFLINVIGMMINNVSFLVIWMFFAQAVGIVGGWTAYDMVGLMGFNTFAYGTILSVLGGIRKLPEYVTNGSFDRFLLSPKNVLLRVATSHLFVSAIGDVLFGCMCLIIYAIHIQATIYQLVWACILVGITLAVFFSMALLSSLLAFAFTDAESMMRTAFEVFFTPSMFHGGAFQGATRAFFIFVIPSLLIGALPVEALRDFDVQKLALMACIATVWCVVSIWLFYRGIRRYESSSLMGFNG